MHAAHLKVFDQLLVLKVHHMHVSIVERAQHPRLGRMQIHALDAVGPRGQASFYVQAKRLK